MSPAALAQRSEPSAPLSQQQLVLDLPQSPRKRQKAFSTMVVNSVKAGDADRALLLYGKAAEVGCMISETVFNAVLSVSNGVRVLSDMVEAGIKPRENHYAFLLREAASRGAFEEAFSQVREMVDGGVRPRLRTYSPLLKGLCHKPDMTLASEVWSHMTAHGVQPTPEEHIDMIKGWAAAGELRPRVADGSVERCLQQLAGMDFELIPCRDAGAAASCDDHVSGSSAGSGDHHLQTLLSAFNADSNFVSSESDVQTYFSSPPRVASVSSASLASGGVCDCCGAALKVVGLDPEARARVRSALVKLASETAYPTPPPPPALPLPPKRRQSSRLDYAYAGEGQGEMDRRGLGEAMGDLERFAAWLEERRREGVHFTTVVDGCNVAYYGQNKEGGKFEISQVDLMARQLERDGERVLVILPERYLRPCVPNSARSRRGKNPSSALSDEDLETIDRWRRRQMLYSCANGTDDDLFWMYFTVSSDATAIEGEEEVTNGDGGAGLRENRQGYKPSNSNGVDGIYVGRQEATPRGGFAGGDDDETRLGGTGEGVGQGGERARTRTGVSSSGDGLAGRLTVVSNDEMRNHRMALLEPVPFKRWRKSQVRGFHFPAILPNDGSRGSSASSTGSSKSSVDEEKGENTSERGRHRPPEQGSSPPLPIVCPSPAFTRDMQVLNKHAWHIPIGEGQDGEPGTKWLCINLAALVEEEEDGQTAEQRPSEVIPRRKYRS
ncbi:conserved unknown protein [Ectocarpus siliculosus]|uniref:PROP1-like PPR domain-containing protein n=1 Tax=Ectocarpus siliculosus TaxID=2880 RepID=D8LD11_ECTSI|nr:conserved unknown protein [Ectocarpus siliculosus]|eukprot:CBN78378.1 conserved unknown protein [Ectocarpus siliculosus]